MTTTSLRRLEGQEDRGWTKWQRPSPSKRARFDQDPGTRVRPVPFGQVDASACKLFLHRVVFGWERRGKEGTLDAELDLGRRIKEAREALNLTQAELAERVGFASRQTVTEQEANRRRVRAAELVTIANVLKTDVSSLLSGSRSIGRPQVLWRARPCEHADETQTEFLQWCERYHRILALTGKKCGDRLPPVTASIDTMSFSDTDSLATQVRTTLDLGSRPAVALHSAIENQLNVLVLYKDLAEGSAACTRGSWGAAILVNRREAPWRRNFDLAHELFHLITWDSFTPRVQEQPDLGRRMEQLANAFASSLLLPADSLRAELQQRGPDGAISWPNLVAIAREFDVSTHALILRLVNLRIVKNDAAEILKQERFKTLDKSSMVDRWWEPPPLPERFVLLAFLAASRGKLSNARLAGYLGCGLAGLPARLAEYGISQDDEGLTLESTFDDLYPGGGEGDEAEVCVA